MSKRLFDEISEQLPSWLVRSSDEQLEQLKLDIETALKKRAKETDYEKVESMIDALLKENDMIEYGDGWKSKKTAEAVEELGNLRFSSIINAIFNLKNVDEQWTIATKYTIDVAGIIGTAEENADKLVNGSLGEFCPDTADLLIEMWFVLLNGDSFPNETIIVEAGETVRDCLCEYDHKGKVVGRFDVSLLIKSDEVKVETVVKTIAV